MTEQVTLMPSIWATNDVFFMSPYDLFELITLTSGEIREKTIDIQRSNMDIERQQEIKKTLPVFIANGVFKNRSNAAMIDYGKHLVIDIDYSLPREHLLRDREWDLLKHDPYVKLMFHTPRGGIKLLIEHDSIDPNQHQLLNDTVLKYYQSNYGVNPDKNCSALSHSHFICFDALAIYNHESKVFHCNMQLKQKPFLPMTNIVHQYDNPKLHNSISVISSPSYTSYEQAIHKAIELSNKKFPVSKGFRNKHLFKIAILLHDWGIPKKIAGEYLVLKYVEPDFLGLEIWSILDSAYR